MPELLIPLLELSRAHNVGMHADSKLGFVRHRPFRAVLECGAIYRTVDC